MRKQDPYKVKKQKLLKAKEPLAVYGPAKNTGSPNKVTESVFHRRKNTIRLFNSFDEMNEADLRAMAAFSPLERFAHVTELLKQFFSEELKNKFSDYTIHYK